MSQEELPDDVRRFILTSIPTVPLLEAVLLLRAHAHATWGASQLARRLYVPEHTAVEVMAQLLSTGIATRSGPEGVRYAPAAGLAELIDRLAQAYSTDLLRVTDLIHSRSDRRAQRFADAFRFRKE
jgi:hypothetical protein